MGLVSRRRSGASSQRLFSREQVQPNAVRLKECRQLPILTRELGAHGGYAVCAVIRVEPVSPVMHPQEDFKGQQRPKRVASIATARDVLAEELLHCLGPDVVADPSTVAQHGRGV